MIAAIARDLPLELRREVSGRQRYRCQPQPDVLARWLRKETSRRGWSRTAHLDGDGEEEGSGECLADQHARGGLVRSGKRMDPLRRAKEPIENTIAIINPE